MSMSSEVGKSFQVAAQYAESITAADTLEHLVELVEEFIEHFVPIDYSGIFLYDPELDRLRLYYAKGFTEEEFKASDASLMERHPGWVFKNKKMLHMPRRRKG